MAKKTFKTRIAESFKGNLSAKLMALLMAIALWFYAFDFSQVVLTSSNPMRVPVKIVRPGWSVDQKTDRVNVTASFPRKNEEQIKQLLRDGQIMIEVSAEPENTGPDEQEKTVVLNETNLRAPKDLEIRPLAFDPPELTFRFIRETTVNVRVIPVITEPPPGYDANVFSFVSSVRVRGRKDIVTELQQRGLRTEPIDISSPPPENAPVWNPSAIALLPSEVEVAGEKHRIWTDESIPVRIDLTRKSTSRKIAGIPIQLLIPPAFPYIASLHGEQFVDVTVQGPPELVDILTPENITVYMEVAGLTVSELPQHQEFVAHVKGIQRADQISVRTDVPEGKVRISQPAGLPQMRQP